MVALIVLGILALGVVWGIMKYNGLVTLRNQVTNGWKQIDVQLKRRHDLIPNLVNTVKGIMEFEQDTLQKVVEARSAAMGARGGKDAAAKEGVLTDALSKFFVVMEQYPQLRSSENVSKLQEELTSTENKISFARQFYNDIATSFNTAQQVFPTNLIAGAFGFQPAELFEITVGGGRFGDRAVLSAANATPIDPSTTDPAQRQLLNVVEEMKIASGLPMPKVYIIPDADPNAFATGSDPYHASLAVTKGLLEKLNREELQGVIAHEMSHIRNLDIRVMTTIAALAGAVVLLSDWAGRALRSGAARSGGGRRSQG